MAVALAIAFTFIIILIAWLGHHNMMRQIDKSSTKFHLANGFFLFTIILMPFPAAFLAEYLDTPYAQPAIMVYSAEAIIHNFAWIILLRSVIHPKPLYRENANLVDLNQIGRAHV